MILNTLTKIHYVLYNTILAVSMFAIVKLLYSILSVLTDISQGQNYTIELLDMIAY